MILRMTVKRLVNDLPGVWSGSLLLCTFFLLISFDAVPVFAQQKNSAAVVRGRQVFGQNCGFCHGADATGGRGPDLVRSPLVAHDVNGNLVAPVIRNGRPEKGMPAFQLAAQDVADIDAFLHSQIAQGIASSQVPRSYSTKWLLTGNAAAGQDYFNGAGGCKNCHSPQGDLAHVASKYSGLKLQSEMLYPSKVSRTVTVTLASGEQVTGRLIRIDEFSVALQDDSGWHRSYSRDNVKVEVHDPLDAHRKLLSKITQDQMHNLFAFLETLK